jgi:hypothetical protein
MHNELAEMARTHNSQNAGERQASTVNGNSGARLFTLIQT